MARGFIAWIDGSCESILDGVIIFPPRLVEIPQPIRIQVPLINSTTINRRLERNWSKENLCCHIARVVASRVGARRVVARRVVARRGVVTRRAVALRNVDDFRHRKRISATDSMILSVQAISRIMPLSRAGGPDSDLGLVFPIFWLSRVPIRVIEWSAIMPMPVPGGIFLQTNVAFVVRIFNIVANFSCFFVLLVTVYAGDCAVVRLATRDHLIIVAFWNPKELVHCCIRHVMKI
mmetsp:Transcript_17671/g.35432  ORF Transcript_17671/g.35432 Transcript_17671/m.35432 type:complete len:235 (-) Transcript_17671:334-1038(-)